MTIEVRDERGDLVRRVEALTAEMEKLAAHEKMTVSQERRFAELSEEMELIRPRLSALDRREQLRALTDGLASGEVKLERGTYSSDEDHAPRRRIGSDMRGRALDLINRAERTTDLGRSVLDSAAGWVERDDSPGDGMARWVLTAGDEDYRSAFAKMIRNPTMGQYEWNDRERAAFARAQELQRAMAVGTDSTGGFLVPFTLDPAVIMTNAGTSNRNLRAAFTVKTIATESWNGVTSAGVTAEWAAEAAEVADASPTLAQPSIPVHRGDAFVPFSFELQGDARDVEAELTPLLVDAKERLEATAFITGTGTGQPKGLITAAVANAPSVVTSTTADAYAVADVYKLKAALPARYRANAAWLANEDIYDLTRQFSTGTGPQSAFWADFGSGTPSQLLGRPVYETSQMDGSVTATAANYLVAYGDLRQYYVIDRVGAQLELISHLFGANRRPTGQRGLLLWFRTGGDLVNPDAVRVLNA